MDAPPVQFATTSDGLSIAYAVRGAGAPLVILPGAFEHVQLAWQYPGLQPWLEGLVQRFRLIQIDERGTGMSIRGLPVDFQYQDCRRDIEAVVEQLKPAPFVLLGIATSVAIAIDYAVNHPERVSALILLSVPGPILGGAGPLRPSFWRDLPEEDWELFLQSLVPRDREPEEARKTIQLLKQAFTARDFARRMTSSFTFHVQELLTRLATPTLILHAPDYGMSGDPSAPMKYAQLSHGQMSAIEGSTIFGNAEQGIRAIEAFLAELALSAPTEPPQRNDTLSSRELEVLRLIAGGRSNAQIAEELVISPNTVGRHVSNIFDKIGATNRVEATVYARDHGFI